jgi:hypothetical protein
MELIADRRAAAALGSIPWCAARATPVQVARVYLRPDHGKIVVHGCIVAAMQHSCKIVRPWVEKVTNT